MMRSLKSLREAWRWSRRRCAWCGKRFRRYEDHNLMWAEGSNELRHCCDACYPLSWGGAR